MKSNGRYSRFPNNGFATMPRKAEVKSVETMDKAFQSFQNAVQSAKETNSYLPSLEIIDQPTVNAILGLFANFQRGYIALSDISHVLGTDEDTIKAALGIED